MKALLFFIIYFLSVNFGYSGGSGGSGPPMTLANCIANAIVVQPLNDQPGFAFRNDVIKIDETGLIGQMSPKAFATFKNVVTSGVDYSAIQSIWGQKSEAVPVRELYFSENPNSIEMVLENEQVIHISPSKRPPLGTSSFCRGFMRMGTSIGESHP